MTSASPLTLTIACRSDGTRLISFTGLHTSAQSLKWLLCPPVCRRELSWALGTPGRSDLVDPHELNELVAARLVRRHDALGPQVLQHPVVGIVWRSDPGQSRQGLLESRDRHLLFDDRPRGRENPEAADVLATDFGHELHEHLVADEVVVGVRPA